MFFIPVSVDWGGLGLKWQMFRLFWILNIFTHPQWTHIYSVTMLSSFTWWEINLWTIKISFLIIWQSMYLDVTNSQIVDPGSQDSTNMCGEDGHDPPVVGVSEHVQAPVRTHWQHVMGQHLWWKYFYWSTYNWTVGERSLWRGWSHIHSCIQNILQWQELSDQQRKGPAAC